MTIMERLEQAKGLMTVRQVAELLNCHKMTVYGWTQAGTIPHLRVGARLKFDPAELLEWLRKRQMA